MFEWDEDKREGNVAKHGVDFPTVVDFDFSTALVRADTRAAYGEVRLIALGFVGDRLYALCYTIRRAVRVISLRKANKKEVRHYAENA